MDNDSLALALVAVLSFGVGYGTHFLIDRIRHRRCRLVFHPVLLKPWRPPSAKDGS